MEKTKETLRTTALAWWKQLKSNIQLDYWRIYQKTTFTPSHSPNELTGREIEEIYDKEVLKPKRQEEWQESQVNRRYSKPNQKQFKEFNSKLARAYLNKFDNNAKKHFCLELFNMLSKSDLQYLKSCLLEIISEK